ncbi:MAG: thioredoxin family protein [Acidobacteriota bacterium]
MQRRVRWMDRLISGVIASAGAALLAFVGSVAFGPCAYAEMSGGCERVEGEAGVEWWSTSRDVYVDGELTPAITVWGSDDHMALFLPDEPEAVVIEQLEDDELRLLSMAKASLCFEDPQTATSFAPDRARDGAVHLVGESLWIEDGDRRFLVSPHQGQPGEMAMDDLWRGAPVWRDLHDAYEPDAAAVETLAAEERELALTVAFGTWCGDSRRSVPRLLKALELADNENLSVELVSIDRPFTDPLDFVAREQITNVPTVIVRDGDREVGRFVERPRSEVVESDVAAILAGSPVPANVYFRDDDVLLASGVLGVFDGDRRIGEERWRLFSMGNGGHRLYVRQSDADGSTESWLRFSIFGQPAFAEVTRRADTELSRTRLWRRGDAATSTTRGDATGIVRQSVDWPAGAVLLAPGVSGVGLAWRQAGRPTERLGVQAYALASVREGAPGRMEAASVERLDDASVAAPGGAVDTVAVRVDHGERSGRYWLLRDLDVPVAVELDDGRRYVLESLERPAPAADAGDDASVDGASSSAHRG